MRNNVKLIDEDGVKIGTETVSSKRVIQVSVVKTVGGGGGGALSYATQNDEFTATGSGTSIDCSTAPLKYWSISVKKSGTVTSWTVLLRVSLTGNANSFVTIATHTNSTGNDTPLLVPTSSLALYARAECSALDLGGGTKITSTIVGSQ